MITKIRKKVDVSKALLAQNKAALETLEASLVTFNEELNEIEVNQELFQTAVKLIYDGLSAKLSDVITEGLHLVFPDSNYSFVIEFVERRNSVECDMHLTDPEGHIYDLFDDVGGGIVDFVAMLLRIMYILLSEYNPVLIADEPLRFIDRENVGTAIAFIKKVCADFDFRLLVITHIPEMNAQADVAYHVYKQGKISKIRIDK